jgi:hypothetical protein
VNIKDRTLYNDGNLEEKQNWKKMKKSDRQQKKEMGMAVKVDGK